MTIGLSFRVVLDSGSAPPCAPRCRLQARASGAAESRTRGTARIATSAGSVVRDERRRDEPHEHGVDGQHDGQPRGGSGHQAPVAHQPAPMQARSHPGGGEQLDAGQRGQDPGPGVPQRRHRMPAPDHPIQDRPDDDEQRQAKQHAGPHDPRAAGETDAEALHELLPGRGEESRESQQRDHDRARSSEDIDDIDDPIDHHGPGARQGKGDRHGHEDDQPRDERAPDRRLQLGGDERGARERPCRRERHAGGIAPTLSRRARGHRREASHQGWGDQHAQEREPDEHGRLVAGEGEQGQLERQQDADERRQRPGPAAATRTTLERGRAKESGPAEATAHPRSGRPGRTLPANRAPRHGARAPRRSRRRDTRAEAAAPARRPARARGLRAGPPG